MLYRAVVDHAVVGLLVPPALDVAHRAVRLLQAVHARDIVGPLGDEVERTERAALVRPLQPVEQVVLPATISLAS